MVYCQVICKHFKRSLCDVNIKTTYCEILIFLVHELQEVSEMYLSVVLQGVHMEDTSFVAEETSTRCLCLALMIVCWLQAPDCSAALIGFLLTVQPQEQELSFFSPQWSLNQAFIKDKIISFPQAICVPPKVCRCVRSEHCWHCHGELYQMHCGAVISQVAYSEAAATDVLRNSV